MSRSTTPQWHLPPPDTLTYNSESSGHLILLSPYQGRTYHQPRLPSKVRRHSVAGVLAQAVGPAPCCLPDSCLPVGTQPIGDDQEFLRPMRRRETHNKASWSAVSSRRGQSVNVELSWSVESHSHCHSRPQTCHHHHRCVSVTFVTSPRRQGAWRSRSLKRRPDISPGQWVREGSDWGWCPHLGAEQTWLFRWNVKISCVNTAVSLHTAASAGYLKSCAIVRLGLLSVLYSASAVKAVCI